MSIPLFGVVDAGILAAGLRVVVGAALVAHGLPKVRGGWKQSGQWIQSMGVPAAAAVPVTILEFFGGIFLIVGLMVPVVAGFLAIQFIAITAMKKSKMNASFIGSQGKASYEVDILYLLLALALLALGAGAVSLDSFIGF